MDHEKMEAGIRTFLEGLGGGFEGDDLGATPARVARAWTEDLCAGYRTDPLRELTWTPVAEGGGPVLVRGISLASICVHHLLPFFGFADVAYLPGRRLAGLSKIGRVIDAHARRLQTQERLTAAIVNTLEEGLACRGALALVRAEHTCMTLRGVRKEHSRMLTVAARGVYESDPAARAEVLGLLQGTGGGACRSE
jgi:GTP cyclohydrolase I